jgi:glucokinase
MSDAPTESLIVADIGGTNARFAIAEAQSQSLAHLKSYKTRGFGTFEDALGAYLRSFDDLTPRAISIGAAGPLSGGKIHLTNLDWTIDPAALAHAFSLKTAMLTNDLVAMAAGIARAPAAAFEPLPGSQAKDAFRTLVIAIGTGLGVAWYERAGGRVMVHPTEAGHMSFAPIDQASADLLIMTSQADGALSFESIISGSGIKLVYATLRGSAPAYDNSEAIFVAAESGSNPTARNALALVTSALATFARDLMHVLGGVDEIVFAGGLGRRLKRELQSQKFLNELRAARGGPLDFSKVGARLALDDKLPLMGAMHLALGAVDFDHRPVKDSK